MNHEPSNRAKSDDPSAEFQAHLSFAAFPGGRYDTALRALAEPPAEPLLGSLQINHVQITPQLCWQRLDESVADSLTAAAPQTQFRLHANVRVVERTLLRDLVDAEAAADYFAALAAMSKRLRAPAYTAHAGKRRGGSLRELFERTRRLTDVFECPVGIEGAYATRREPHDWLVNSWSEYREVFESGLPYALDLSHINIVAAYERRRETELLTEMLACERCIEIHVSANDGRADSHRQLSAAPWWWSLRSYFNPAAVVFSEGNQLERKPEVNPTGE